MRSTGSEARLGFYFTLRLHAAGIFDHKKVECAPSGRRLEGRIVQGFDRFQKGGLVRYEYQKAGYDKKKAFVPGGAEAA